MLLEILGDTWDDYVNNLMRLYLIGVDTAEEALVHGEYDRKDLRVVQ